MENKLLKEIPINKKEHVIISPSFRKELYKTLGTDETISAVIVSIIAPVLQSMSLGEKAIALGTVSLEKVGLFTRSAIETYEKESSDTKAYLKRIRRSGKPSLIRDLTLHDPYFVSLMMTGQHLFPDADRGTLLILTLTSFGTALMCAIETEVRIGGYVYNNFQKKIEKNGALSEKYFETKGYIANNHTAYHIYQDIVKRYDLGSSKHRRYEDTYYNKKRNLVSVLGMTPKIRTRERIDLNSNFKEISSQIIYTRSFRANVEDLFDHDQIISPVNKHKYTFPISEAQDQHPFVIQYSKQNSYARYGFDRMYANKQEKALVGIDSNHSQNFTGTFWESKAFPAYLDIAVDITKYAYKNYKKDIRFFTVGKEKVLTDAIKSDIIGS